MTDKERIVELEGKLAKLYELMVHQSKTPKELSEEAAFEANKAPKHYIKVRVLKNMIGEGIGLVPHKTRVEQIDPEMMNEYPGCFKPYKGGTFQNPKDGLFDMDKKGIEAERLARIEAIKKAKAKKRR